MSDEEAEDYDFNASKELDEIAGDEMNDSVIYLYTLGVIGFGFVLGIVFSTIFLFEMVVPSQFAIDLSNSNAEVIEALGETVTIDMGGTGDITCEVNG